MKRMKHSKKAKYIGIGLASLGAVSVFSIGFASWIIGATDVTKTDTIDVKVATVNTEELSLAVVEEGSDSSISFGPNKEESGGLIYSTGEDEEDLTAVIKLTLTSQYRTMARNINFKIDYATDLTGLATKNYITLPFNSGEVTPVAELAQVGTLTAKTGDGWKFESNMTTTETANAYTVKVVYDITVTLTFGWGTAFGSANPIKATATTGNQNWTRDSLKKALEELAAVTTKSLTVTITSSQATS